MTKTEKLLMLKFLFAVKKSPKLIPVDHRQQIIQSLNQAYDQNRFNGVNIIQ